MSFSDSSKPDSKFEVMTPVGFVVRTSQKYWQKLLVKHPDLQQYEEILPSILKAPDCIYRSKSDDHIFLLYKTIKLKRWLVIVVKRLNGDGFIVTCYQTSAIKKGILEWSNENFL
jgi:hypothetical protein